MIEINGRNFNLLTLGQAFLRPSPPDNERLSRGDIFVRQVGEAELDMAVGVVLLGLHTGAIPKLPAHDIRDFMKGKIRPLGVSDDFFMYDQSPAAGVGIYYYENGVYPRKPRMIYDRNHSSFFSLDTDGVPEEVYTAFKCSHTIDITLALNGDIREIIIEMIKRSKAAGTLVSFDVSFRGNLWTGDQAKEYILGILPCVDIFFRSEDIARFTLLETGTAREMTESFTEEFPTSVVASTQRIAYNPKCRIFGSVMHDVAKDEYYKEELYRDIEVTDRTGNGDAYISGALYRLPSTGGDYTKIAAFGNTTTAVKNTIPGDLLFFNLEEIQTIIRVHNQARPQSEMVR